jgi:pyridoxine 4-dehydrogenase
VQNKYNIGDRAHEDVLRYCETHGFAFIPWAPVAGGKLARPGGALDQSAKHHRASLSQLCLAWLLHRSPVMLPIPGTSSIRHLEENVDARGIRLSDAEWSAIEKQAASAA